MVAIKLLAQAKKEPMISKNVTAWSLTAVLIHLLLSTSLLSAWKRWYHKSRLSASDTLALYVYDYNVTYGISRSIIIICAIFCNILHILVQNTLAPG